MDKFNDEEKKRVNYIRHMLFDRMDTLSTPKAQNNNNDAITVLEKMMKECGVELKARADYTKGDTCEYCGKPFGGIDTHNYEGGGTCIPF